MVNVASRRHPGHNATWPHPTECECKPHFCWLRMLARMRILQMRHSRKCSAYAKIPHDCIALLPDWKKCCGTSPNSSWHSKKRGALRTAAALAKTDAVPSVQPSLLRVVSFPEAASMFLPLIRYIYSAMRESETHGSTCRPQVIPQPCLHTVNQD